MLEVITLPKAAVAVCPNDGGFHVGVIVAYLIFANQMRDEPDFELVSTILHEFGDANTYVFNWYCTRCVANGRQNPPRQ
jgi:hypothetical protein